MNDENFPGFADDEPKPLKKAAAPGKPLAPVKPLGAGTPLAPPAPAAPSAPPAFVHARALLQGRSEAYTPIRHHAAVVVDVNGCSKSGASCFISAQTSRTAV